ncbi:MAG: hypothetical protein JWO53_179 [Chlamydiia bacterium]|nr:hypothetical protein [Chlamydiia bacterium]
MTNQKALYKLQKHAKTVNKGFAKKSKSKKVYTKQ